MQREYTHTGKCIWCGREKPEATFNTRPHVFPHSLGSEEIGFDVCDDCNHYFGKAPKAGVPSIDMSFKEIFGSYRFFLSHLDENSYKKFRSAFFTYHHSIRTIRIKSSFNEFTITRQFKRSLYEMFLQKYHIKTQNANHPMFDAVRRYARYDIGNLRVFYAFNNIVLVEKDTEHPHLSMSDKVISDMMESGVYSFWMFGQLFYLEVFSVAFNAKGQSFLQAEAQKVLLPAVGNERILELQNIMQADFFLQRFNNENRR